MKRTKIKPISDRQRKINDNWKKVVLARLALIKEIFGYEICEWCGQPSYMGHELGAGSGHHMKKRRYNVHMSGVCFIAGWCCHDFLEQHPLIEVKQFCFDGAPAGLKIKLLEKLETYKRVNDLEAL